MDQLSGMRIFVRVVQMGSFSAVAREQSTSQATVSKKIAALESMLGVKLLSRSSRELSLTEAGTGYYEKSISILAELDEADALARSQTASPKGSLRIAAPIAIARVMLAPLMKEFTEQYPEINVEIAASDKMVDLIAEGIDAAIRVKQLEDSNLISRHLFNNRLVLAASPDYLAKEGIPKIPEDLNKHNCIVYSYSTSVHHWSFINQGKEDSVEVEGSFSSNDGDTNLAAALAGMGIAQLPIWLVDEHFRSGQLLEVLENYKIHSIPVNIIYPQNRYVPLKVRCFIDFLKDKVSTDSRFFG